MDVEQLFAEFAQLGGSGCAGVDPGAALTLQVHRAPQQQAFARLKAGRVKPGRQCCVAVELGADLGALRAFADHADIGAPASDQLQRIDQD